MLEAREKLSSQPVGDNNEEEEEEYYDHDEFEASATELAEEAAAAARAAEAAAVQVSTVDDEEDEDEAYSNNEFCDEQKDEYGGDEFCDDIDESRTPSPKISLEQVNTLDKAEGDGYTKGASQASAGVVAAGDDTYQHYMQHTWANRAGEESKAISVQTTGLSINCSPSPTSPTTCSPTSPMLQFSPSLSQGSNQAYTDGSLSLAVSDWSREHESCIQSELSFNVSELTASIEEVRMRDFEASMQFAFNEPDLDLNPPDEQTALRLQRSEEAIKAWHVEVKEQLYSRFESNRAQRRQANLLQQTKENSWLQTCTTAKLLREEGACSADKLRALIDNTRTAIANDKPIEIGLALELSQTELQKARTPRRYCKKSNVSSHKRPQSVPQCSRSPAGRTISNSPIHKILARPITAQTTRKELDEMKQCLSKLSDSELRKTKFGNKVTVPRLLGKKTMQKPANVWLVGTNAEANPFVGGNAAVGGKKLRHKRPGSAATPSSTPSPGNRSCLQLPMERPADCPPMVWKYFHDEMTRVATTPRERKLHMSTLGLTKQKDRGMVLDGIGVSHGNGIDTRFYR